MTRSSDAPVRKPGSHARSGNAMARTRAAILDAAAACIERLGVRRTTMSAVSAQAGIAKATLYNHFRAKDDLLLALLESRAGALGDACAAQATAGLAPALLLAGRWLGECGPLRTIADDDPALLARLGSPSKGPVWDLVRHGIENVLRLAGAPTDQASTDVVLRWLCGLVMWPATEAELALGAQTLAHGLGQAPPAAEGAAPAPADGLGWPT